MANKQAKPSIPNNVSMDQDPSQQDNAPKASGHGGKVENDFNQVVNKSPRSAMKASARPIAAVTANHMWVGATSCSCAGAVAAAGAN